jgi:hypothetical protein
MRGASQRSHRHAGPLLIYQLAFHLNPPVHSKPAKGQNVKPSYVFEDWSGAAPVRETHKLASKDSAAGTITLREPLVANFALNQSGLIWPAGGLSGTNVWVTDQASLNGYRVYLGHEMGHTPDLGQWIDVAPGDNIMGGWSYDGSEPVPFRLRFRLIPDYYQRRPDESQWEKVNR